MKTNNTQAAAPDPSGAVDPAVPARTRVSRPRGGEANGARESGPAAGNVSVAELAAQLSKGRIARRSTPGPVNPSTPPAGGEPSAPELDPSLEQSDVSDPSLDGEGSGEDGFLQDSSAVDHPLSASLSPDAVQPGDDSAASSSAESADPGGSDPDALATSAGRPAWFTEALAEAKLPKGREQLLKRLHTLVDQRDMERNRRLQVEQQMQQQAQERPSEISNRKFEISNEPPEAQQLSEQIAQLDYVIQLAENNPDGATVPEGQGRERYFSPQELANARRNAERQRQDLVSERSALRVAFRQQMAGMRKEYAQQARTAYPWLTNPQSAEAKEFAQVVGQLGDLQARFPDLDLWVADAVAGRLARTAKSQNGRAVGALAPRKTPAPAAPPPVPGGGSAAPRRGPVTPVQAVDQARQQFETSGRLTDLAHKFAVQRQSRTRRQ